MDAIAEHTWMYSLRGRISCAVSLLKADMVFAVQLDRYFVVLDKAAL